MCVHICKEKRNLHYTGPALVLRSLLTTDRDQVLPQSHLIHSSDSAAQGGGSLLFAHPTRTTLFCQQAIPRQHWQSSTSKLHSCSGPSPHRPHQRHYRDTPSSLPIFPPPARHTEEALLSVLHPSPCRHMEKTTAGNPSLTLDPQLFLCF